MVIECSLLLSPWKQLSPVSLSVQVMSVFLVNVSEACVSVAPWWTGERSGVFCLFSNAVSLEVRGGNQAEMGRG